MKLSLFYIKKVCFLSIIKKTMPYARRIRRSTVKRATRRTTRKAKYGSGDKSASFGKAARSTLTARKPAFSFNTGNANHIDRPLIQGGALPATLFTKHRYSEQLILYTDNLTNRTGTETAFRLNSLYDPNFTSALNHQPLGFDQFAAMYKVYRVYKVDVQVRITGKFGSAVTFLAVNVRPGQTSYQLGGLKNGAEILEQPSNTIMDVALNQSWAQSYYIADIDGVTRQRVMTDDQYCSSTSTNPALGPFLSVACGTWDEPASASNGAYAVVSFVYHTMWCNTQALPQS